MTGVPRLQHLPAPGSTSGALAVATLRQGRGDQRVQPVTPVTTAQRNQPEPQWARSDHGSIDRSRSERDRVDESRRGGVAPRGERGGAEAANAGAINFSRLSSLPFMVQVLGQQAGRGPSTQPQTSLSGHRDAAQLSSDIYRRAGGEPEMLPDSATFVRLAV
jgi:hypothetical protein